MPKPQTYAASVRKDTVNSVRSLSFNKRGWATDLILIALACIVLYLGFHWLRPLANPDEGRYSEIPYEMVQSGDWVTPRLNGVPYFYKPPLFYWMQAVSIELFGIGRTSLRLANSMMAIFTIMFTYAAARLLYNSRRTALFSAAVLATSIIFFAMGQIATLDMTLSAFLSAGLFSILLGFEASSARVRGVWFFAAFVFMALALMTKGLIGVVIPGAVVFIYWILTGIARPFKRVVWSDVLWCALGIAAFAAITVPWHVLVSAANPPFEGSEGLFSQNHHGQGFFWYYFVHEHFLRYVDVETSMRGQPWYFFILCLLAGFLPWTLILYQSVSSAASGGWRNMRGGNPKALYLCVWIAFVLVFFSISKSKLIPYIIPVFPALAVLAGAYLSKLWKDPVRSSLRPTVLCFSVFGLVLAVVPPVVYYILSAKEKLEQPSSAVFWALSALLLVSASLAGFFALKGKPRAGLITVLAASALFLLGFNPIGAQAQRAGCEELVKVLKKARTNSETVCVYGYGDAQDLPLWLGEVVTVAISAPEEQSFGYLREERIHRSRYINSNEEFSEFLKSGKKIFLVCRVRDIPAMEEFSSPLKLKELYRNSRMALLCTQ